MNNSIRYLLNILLVIGFIGLFGIFFLRYINLMFFLTLFIIALLLIKIKLQRKQINYLMNWTASFPRDLNDSRNKLIDEYADTAEYIEKLVDRKNDQIQLNEKKLDKLFGALNLALFGIILLDSEQKIEWFNQKSIEYFGLIKDKDLKQNIIHLVRLPKFIQYLKSKKFNKDFQFNINGRHFLMHAIVYDIDKLFLIIQDITNQIELDEKHSSFVANVSHELRTPLTVISGYLETMQIMTINKEEQKNILFAMDQQTKYMTNLINDLLEISRLEQIKMTTLDDLTSVDELFININELTNKFAVDKKVDINYTNDTFIIGCKSEIISAINNLVVNAIRYTKPQDSISINWYINDQGEGIFSVVDSGEGIAAEHIPKLADRFYRVDKGRSRSSGGTGLGLAIVKQIMLHHNGKLIISSQEGIGSTFKLIFPSIRIKK